MTSGDAGWQAQLGGFDAIYDICVLSANDVWAIGSHIVHYDGRAWTVTTPWPDARGLRGIDFVSSDDGWAVGYDGAMLHYQGGQWVGAPTVPGVTFLALDMVTATEGWAVGGATASGTSHGVVYHFNGADWSEVATANTSWLHDVSMVSTSDGYAVGAQGAILHFDGTAWRSVSAVGNDDLYGVVAVAPNNVWAVGGTDGMLPDMPVRQIILHFDGSGWTTTLDQDGYPLTAIAVTADYGWAVGAGGTPGNGVIFRYDGHSWQPQGIANTVAPHSGLRAVALLPGERAAIAASDTGLVIRLRADGWEVQHAERWLTGLVMSSPDDGWAVGPGGPALRYDGQHWTPAGNDVPELGRLEDVDGVSSNDLWGVGQAGDVVHYNGLGWKAVAPESDVDLHRVRVVSSDDAWAVGDRWMDDRREYQAEVLHWDGTWWSLSFRDTGAHMALRDIDVTAAGDVWAAGNGFVLHYSAEGWVNMPVNADLYTIDMVSSTDGWAAGSRTILHFDGRTWTQVVGRSMLEGISIERLQMNPDGTGWGVGWSGVVLYFDGRAWQFVRSPRDPLASGACPYALFDLAVLGQGTLTRLWTVGAPEAILSWSGNVGALPTVTPTATSTPYSPPRRPTPSSTPTLVTGYPIYLPRVDTGE